ncbi:hypothetical protein RhiirA4_395188 [Rhizophagus irregularis]|uniref:Uncharacterized protein n=1 Tax=Rhizophagus irregularis TaxID=588596 RepID=A0A2I1G2H1_9GLOM|nr:hypothetical protein RhiirA4_395188 [Rhizophagus irregularis]
MVRKRTDTARKIYNIFSVIGEDKILRVKSFTAYSFLDLTRSEVTYIIKFSVIAAPQSRDTVRRGPPSTLVFWFFIDFQM